MSFLSYYDSCNMKVLVQYNSQFGTVLSTHAAIIFSFIG